MRLQRVKYGRALGRVERDLNRVIDALNENRLASGVGYRLKRTAHGTGLDIEMPDIPEAGQPVRQFKLISVSDDTLEAAEWDGQDVGAVVTLAKPYKLRKTPFHGQTIQVTLEDPIAGNQVYTITYDYHSATFRLATLVGQVNFAERQVIIPLYRIGDVLYGTEPDNGTEVDGVNWLDINVDGRAWARKF